MSESSVLPCIFCLLFVSDYAENYQALFLRVFERLSCATGGGADIANRGGGSADHQAVSFLDVSHIGIV